MQVLSELNKTTYIDRNSITEFIKDIEYPLYYLDFETMTSGHANLAITES